MVLLITYNIHFHFLFYVLWLLLGGLSTLRMVRTAFPISHSSAPVTANYVFVLPVRWRLCCPAQWAGLLASSSVGLYLCCTCSSCSTCTLPTTRSSRVSRSPPLAAATLVTVRRLTVQLTLLVSVLSGLLDSLEGPNLAPIQRVARDVPEMTLNATVRNLGTLPVVR